MNSKKESSLLLTYGFFATMPILTFLGNTWFTWMSIFVAGFYIVSDFKKGKIKKTIYIVIFILAVLSSILCFLSDMQDYWKDIQWKNMIWEAIFLVVFLHFNSHPNDKKAVFFIKGVYYASIFQMFWGFLQFILYHIGGMELNDVIFGQILQMQDRTLTQYRGTSIALSGLCWNVGNMAALIVIGFLLTNSPALKIMFVIFSAISGSRTLLLGIVTCLFCEIVIHISDRKKRINSRAIVVAVGLIAALAVFLFTNQHLMSIVYGKIDFLLTSFSVDYLTSQSSSRLHSRYWITIPEVTNWSGIIHSLFGWGNGCSGYPFSQLYNQYVGESWVVECDFINRLWSFGYVNFILWYGWMLYHMKKSFKVDKRYLVLFVALLVEGITYNVTLNWCYLTMLLIYVMIKQKRNMFEELQMK